MNMEKCMCILIKAKVVKEEDKSYYSLYLRNLETWEKYNMIISNEVPGSLAFIPYLKFGQVFTNILISNRHRSKDDKYRLAYNQSDFLPIPNKFLSNFDICKPAQMWINKYKEVMLHEFNDSLTEKIRKLNGKSI
jgi:hypothetical protein